MRYVRGTSACAAVAPRLCGIRTTRDRLNPLAELRLWTSKIDFVASGKRKTSSKCVATAVRRRCYGLKTLLAGRQGFEPRYRGPEPRVLPLDDLPVPVATLAGAGTRNYSESNSTPASITSGTGTHRTVFERDQRVSSSFIIGAAPASLPLGIGPPTIEPLMPPPAKFSSGAGCTPCSCLRR
jgi:hypothetical protein